MSEKKYQIFISSTYKDLIEAREKIIETILNMYHFPIGMEMFSADDDDQWQVIKDTIDQSDYYVLILGHRYGTETSEGISYTEKEYDYATLKGIPILAFIRERDVATKPGERDSEADKIEKLNRFISKAEANKMRNTWTTIDDLGRQVAIALPKNFRKKPRVGWVRADKAISPELTNELTILSKENRELRATLDELQKQIEEKAPDIDVCLNKEGIFKVICKELPLPRLDYPKKLSVDDIPDNLRKDITQDDIDDYNAKLPTNEKVNLYNQRMELYFRTEKNSTDFSVVISNIGKIKANEVFIDMIFPPNMCITEKDAIEDLEMPKDIMPENPINKAKKKYKQSGNSLFGGHLNFMEEEHNRYLSGGGISTLKMSNLLTHNINRNYSINVQNNKVSIRLDTLMHTRERVFKDLVIIPFERGDYEVEVTVMCEEYSEPKVFNLPITVIPG